MNDGCSHGTEFAVDLTDQALDTLAFALVEAHILAAGHRDLHHCHVLGGQLSFGQKRAKCFESGLDALGVVEAVHPEQQRPRMMQLKPKLSHCVHHRRLGRLQFELIGNYGHRVASHPHVSALVTQHRQATGCQIETTHQEPEIARRDRLLKADHIGAEQSAQHLGTPWQLQEQLGRRKRDMQEKPDPHIRATSADHRRDELQVVVVDPDGATRGDRRRGDIGEPLVDRHVVGPGRFVERRATNGVVIQRP